MDIDDLTPMAYEIIIKADSILDVLKTEIGASCSMHDTEDSFLNGTLQSVDQNTTDPESYLDFWNYLDELCVGQFKEDLEDLKKFIIKTIEAPLSERTEAPLK